MPEMALFVGVRDFQIGDRGLAVRAPVNHVLAAVDQPFFVEADEDFANGGGKASVEREALARPVAACTQADHLALDGVARFGFELPNALFKFFAAQFAVIDSFLGELARHHHLGGDAGVIGSWKPQGVFSKHPMPADGNVDLGVFEHVADVQRAGHVGRWNNQRKHRAGPRLAGAEDPGIDPPPSPLRLEPLGLVDFLNLHGGTIYDNRGAGRAEKERLGRTGPRPASVGYSACSVCPTLSTARKASCGISTRPTRFMRFLPSFCFSKSLRLRVMSPP